VTRTVFSALASPALLAGMPDLPGLPEWAKAACYVLVAIMGPAATVLVTRGLVMSAAMLRSLAAARRARAKEALADNDPTNDVKALQELMRADVEDAAAQALSVSKLTQAPHDEYKAPLGSLTSKGKPKR